MRIKKSKIFKTISFSSLALLMSIAGTMAFSPLGAGPSVASANEMVDQINTKADGENIKYAPSALGLDPENDPVIYTTESGLEIKYGGLDLNASLGSGPLKGYPYFTMGTYSSKAVNWIIIGRNSNLTTFNNAIQNYLFSTWKNKTSAIYNKYFFGNTYETTTPAGSAINTAVSSKSYIQDFEKISLSSITTNSEIPSGCVLAISECVLYSCWFNASSGASAFNSTTANTSKGGRYRYAASNAHCSQNASFTYSGTAGTLYTEMLNLYNTNLGLTTAQQNLIQGQKLNTYYMNGRTEYLETYSTDGNTLHKFFPLATYRAQNGTNPSVGTESFDIGDYLNTDALRVAYQIGTSTARAYWGRTGGQGGYAYSAKFMGDTGTPTEARANNSWGVRPACVIKLA